MKTVHYYGKIFRTHIEKGSAWTEALNPYEAKSRRIRREPRRRSIEQTIIYLDASAVAVTHILASESGSAESSESAVIRGSISDRLTLALTKFCPKKTRSSSWIWEYVHRMCAIGRMDL
ncbi:hypothetical protein N7490_006803 [Penicillium lividum]|nr:hypothetical protein N7490_006803 [Penicillium lividum]